MKKIYISASLVLMGFLFVLAGCGSSRWDSAYCAKGADEIGVDICIPEPVPVESSNVNAFVTDCNGNGMIDSDELLRDHNATVAMTSTQIISETIDPYPVTIQGYTITYIPDLIDYPGIRDFKPLGPVNIIFFDNGTITQDVVLVDLERKGEFAMDINTGRFNPNLPQRYTAVYKFFGEKFGEEFESEAHTTFTIGVFCE